MMTTMTITTTPSSLVLKTYVKLKNNILKFKKVVDRPLTISEKIMIGHLDEEMRSLFR